MNNDAAAQTGVRRILAAFDAATPSTSSLDALAEMATLLQARLELLLVEDSELAQVAGLPPARQINLRTGAVGPLAPNELAAEFRAREARLRRWLADAAAKRQLRWAVRTVRGEAGRCVAVGVGGVRPPRAPPSARLGTISIVMDGTAVHRPAGQSVDPAAGRPGREAPGDRGSVPPGHARDRCSHPGHPARRCRQKVPRRAGSGLRSHRNGAGTDPGCELRRRAAWPKAATFPPRAGGCACRCRRSGTGRAAGHRRGRPDPGARRRLGPHKGRQPVHSAGAVTRPGGIRPSAWSALVQPLLVVR